MTCKEQIYTYDVNEISNSESDYSITPYIVWNFILRLSLFSFLQGTLHYYMHQAYDFGTAFPPIRLLVVWISYFN